MVITEIQKDDLEGLLELYTQLHDNPMPTIDENISGLWQSIFEDKNHHIIVAKEDNVIISSCV
jgi:hypothetical protein